jgi:aryl-alcohol dehydrogenase-like predicted oxidoreductase
MGTVTAVRLQVSALSFWPVTFGAQVAEDIAYECMHAAHEARVNFFDNAEVYAGGRPRSSWGTI